MKAMKNLDRRALERIAIVAESYARRAPSDSVSKVIAELSTSNDAVASTIVAGLAKGWPKDKPPQIDTTGEEALAKLFAKLSPTGRANLVSLADRWGNDSLKKHAAKIAESFVKTVEDAEASDKDRVSAAAQLVDFQKNDVAVVEKLFVPLGAPVFLSTTYPLSTQPLERLVMAQDTGGAIRGAQRADFFWGSGAEAGAIAGRMRQPGRLWVLWPRGAALPRPLP
jgi:3D (Asp-Asp-Asp) domain-containing protein